MQNDELNQHLSKISTMWSVLREAHAGPGTAASAAQRLLLERYGPAVHRYLLRAVGDPHAAADLLQEFALALIQGSLRGADPQRQRFRYYVKSVLFHLVSKYCKEQKRSQPLSPDSPALAGLAAPTQEEKEFDGDWRAQFLTRTWEALRQTQPGLHEVLRFRADHPDLGSTEMAEQLSQRLGKNLTPEAVRQTLHRARARFADLLLDEVAHSLAEPTREKVEEELADLNLLEYCGPALARRLGQGPD